MLTSYTRGALLSLPGAQAVTPEALNQIADDTLFARVDAVLTPADDEDAPRRAALAPFVTKALALRVWKRIDALKKRGACAIAE